MVRERDAGRGRGPEYGVPLEECLEGLRRAKLTKGRLERKMVRGICILDDSYNANPDSMVAALRDARPDARAGASRCWDR